MRILSFPAPPVNRSEVFRYMRTKETAEADAIFKECAKEAEKVFSYSVVCETYPVTFFEESADNGLIDLCFAKVYSKDLYKNLKDCEKIVLFGATVGMGIDRLITKYSVLSPARALCFQAMGAERAEASCDAFNDSVKAEFGALAPRFSPGYGDLDLSVQKDIFNALPMGRIGVVLGDVLLMSPSKSVTAVIGVRRR